jgi:BCCT family betaine/carnitine transporter
MLEGLPMTELVSMLGLVLIAIFFVTSADSGSLVVDTITAGGKMDAPVRQRVFWCVLVGLVAIVLLLGGGMSSLQALAISVGLPFCIILLLMCASLYKGMRAEIS